MRYALLASVLVLTSPAFATGNGPPNNVPPGQGGNSTANAAAAASANAAAKAFQAQHQYQSQNTTVRNTNTNVNANVAHGGSARATGGQGGQGGNAASSAAGYGGAGGNSSGASSNTNVNIEDRLQAPAIGIPGIAIGNNCGLGASVGASFAGVAFGGAYSWADKDCLRMAFAASMPNMPDVQLAILCQSEIVSKAMATAGRTCPGTAPAPTPTASTPQRVAAAPNCNAPWVNGVMTPKPAGC